MIPGARITDSFVQLTSDTTVQNAQTRANGKTFVLVDFGADAGQRYQVMVAAALPGLPKDKALKDAAFGFRTTEIVPRSALVNDINDQALEHLHVSFLVVDKHGDPLGIFIAKGSNLGDEDVAGAAIVFTVNCPIDSLAVFTSKVGGVTLTCPKGHSFTA